MPPGIASHKNYHKHQQTLNAYFTEISAFMCQCHVSVNEHSADVIYGHHGDIQPMY